MSVGCNEVQSASVDVDKNAKRMLKMLDYWASKTNIKNRYSSKNGLLDKRMAEDGLESFARDILDFPWVPEQNFTDRQLRRLKVAINGFNKDLGGKFKNIAGIFAVPRGLARLDPSSNKFLSALENAKNYERNKISYVESYLQDIKDMILKAHIDEGKGSRLFGNKSYKDFRNLREKIFDARDENLEIKAHAKVEEFFRSDNGKLLNEYRQLMKMGSKKQKNDKGFFVPAELDIAIGKGYKYTDPATNIEKTIKYNPRIVNAVRKSHEMLDDLGRVNMLALDQLKRVIDIKYSRFSDQRKPIVDRIEAAKERIKEGIARGDYYPKITLETMHDIKVNLEKIIPAKTGNDAIRHLEQLNTITDKLLTNVNKMPQNVKAGNSHLNLLWDQDPYVILEKYSRDAVQFNKNLHIQRSYLEAMKSIPNRTTPFLKGLRSFIIEEYSVANPAGAAERPQWVKDWVRTINGLQTARTMGLNITGGVKNAASVLHYMSKVGPRAIFAAKRGYQDNEIKAVYDKVATEAGFLFTPKESAILMEGLIGRDKYKQSDLVFNEHDQEYYYKDTRVRDIIETAGNKTLGGLLMFHRWTENGQRNFMFRTSFINKYQELKDTSNLTSVDRERFAKNFALKMVNGWAYEYAPFAKSKYVRGDGLIVDEIGEVAIVKRPVKGLVQEVAFHLMHYPMSLLETHIKELKGAGQSIKAQAWDSPEMQYAMRYAGLFGMIQLGSILLNVDLNNMLENETINRLYRIEKDIVEEGSKEKATFGLLSEFTGPTIGHLKYWSITSGLTKLDTPLKRRLLGNIDYTLDTEDSRRYTDYQYSTEYGRFRHKILPALRDGRGVDLLRHWLALYPSSWIKTARRSIGLQKKPKTSKYTTAQVLSSLRQFPS